MAIPQTNAKQFRTRSKNWFVLAISTASSAETTTHILHDPITDTLPAILTVTDAPSNLPTMTPNPPALLLPQLIPHYAA